MTCILDAKNQAYDSQLCIDLGSSRYILAMQEATAEICTINIKGQGSNSKLNSAANVIMQDAVNHEYVPPHQIIFGELDNDKMSQNIALMLNWKNYFFESHACIKYPDSPTMPSSNNRSARIRVSAIFEAFIYQSVVGFLGQLKMHNNTHLITLLIPSLNVEQHKQFLNSCFKAVVQLLKDTTVCIDGIEMPLTDRKFIFQFKNEAVAGVATALKKKIIKQLDPKTTVILADLGGFTSDFAKITVTEDRRIIVEDRAINIAGNNIDLIRKAIFQNQLADIPLFNQYVIHQEIVKVKEKGTPSIEVDKNHHFFKHIDICCYILQFIIESLYRIKEIIQSANLCDFGPLQSIIRQINPYVKANMTLEQLFDPDWPAEQLVENIKKTQMKFNKYGDQIPGEVFSFEKLQKQNIPFWVFDNLKPEVRQEMINSFLEYHEQKLADAYFLKQKEQLKIEMQKILKRKVNEVNDKLKGINQTYADQVIKVLPHFITLQQFELFIREKIRREGQQEKDHPLFIILNFMKELIQFNTNELIKIQSQSSQLFDEKDQKFIYNMVDMQPTQAVLKSNLQQYYQSLKLETQECTQRTNKFAQTYTQFSDVIRDIYGKIIFIQNLFPKIQIFKDENKKMYCSAHDIQKQIQEFFNKSYNANEKLNKTLNNNYQISISNTQHPAVAFFQELISQTLEVNSLRFLKLMIQSLAQKDMQNILQIESIQLSLNGRVIFNLNQKALQYTQNCVTSQILTDIEAFINENKENDRKYCIILSGGFSKVSDIQNCITDQKSFLFHAASLDETDLAIGGIENMNTFTGQENAHSIQYNVLIDENNKISFSRDSQLFNQNRINMDQGTTGSQGYYAWANQTYSNYIQTKQDIFDDNVRKRGGQTALNKMPSYCIVNFSRLLKILNTLSKRYIENGQPTNEFPDVLKLEPLTNTQLQQILSFETVNELEFEKDAPKAGKSKMKKVQQPASAAKSSLKIEKSWKRRLYEIENPEFPNYPIIQSKVDLVQDGVQSQYVLNIPLSLIYVSQLLFFKQKYQFKFQNASHFANTIAVTMTVPCGANQRHLHFVRCCCKQAGWGDNISFVFEPLSAFAHMQKAQELSLNITQNQELQQFLVIDAGGGTTDVAFIQQENKEFTLKSYTSIVLAGDTIDNKLKDEIDFKKIFEDDDLPPLAQVALNSYFYFCKELKEQKLCELTLEESCIKKILPRLGLQQDATFEIQKQKIEQQLNQQNVDNVVFEEYKTQGQQETKSFKLKFEIKQDCIRVACENVYYQIAQKVRNFLQHIVHDKDTINIMCVGGLGSSKEFQKEVEKQVKNQASKMLPIDVNDAQQSVPSGGVFLAQEKDHVNPEAEGVSLIEAQQDLADIPDLILCWMIKQHQIFQRRDDWLSQPFLKHANFNNNCYFRIASGWDGVKFKIQAAKGEFSQEALVHFTVPELNEWDGDGELEHVPFQFKYIVHLEVSNVDDNNKKLTVIAKLMKEVEGWDKCLVQQVEVQYDKL